MTEMSEEEEAALNIKRPLKRARVGHSTPAEVSTLSPKMWDISPMTQRASRLAHFFEEKPLQSKARNSMHLLRGSLSTVPGPSKEVSSGSRFTFPTRRLSTITGSEESTETLHQTVVLPETSGGKMRNSEQSHRKSRKMVMELEPKRQERPASRGSRVRNKIKRDFQKQLVKKKVREWELRQLINIEEAVTHELVIEEVQSWK